MSRYIDIEPYEKDGWYLQKTYHNTYGAGVKTTPLISVPTADAEPIKHGWWLRNKDGHSCLCSVCGTPYRWSEAETMRYCKVCGARMDAQIGEDTSHPFAESVMMGMRNEVEE